MTRSFILILNLLLWQAITKHHTMEILSTCCQSVNIDEPCRSLCESTILKSNNQTQFCPEIEKCMELINKNRHWQGRSCCNNAVMKRCSDGCQISSSTKMLSEYCRKSDEFALYSCIDTLERKSKCCSYAKTHDCMQVCQQMMFNKTIDVNSLEEELHLNCKNNNEDVVNCVYDNVNIVTTHQQKFKACCGFAHDKSCLEACKTILNGDELTENKIELLENECGSVNLNVEIWKCFLANESKNSNNNNNVMTVGDLAKLNCCIEKAQSQRCRKICINVYTYADMNSLDIFYKECLTNFTEISLSQCIEEIESPVELGCDGLTFCNNFSHRPRELFRSCNKFSDIAAKNEYSQWTKKSSLKLFGEDILINHSESCLSLLQTFACTLHLKPSTKSLHYNQICHEDCLEIISTCNHNIEIKICSNLPKNIPCIHLKDFSHSIHDDYDENEIKMPCKEHQCNATTEICEIDRMNNKYYCSKGACQIGQGSSLLVPSNTFVRIPSKMEAGCFQICKCQDGNLIKCTNLNCVKYSSCTIGNQTISHGSSIEIECNTCGCFAGEITCTRKKCRLISDVQTSFMSLPCNCPPHFTPICGKNGKTYPSSCIAKCNGLNDNDFTFGACENIDPCSRNNIKCKGNLKCFPNRQVCLSSPKNICLQHKCMKYELDIIEPSFDHKICSNSETVCGVNGVTYKNECDCIKDFSMVDYYGNCKAVGLIDSKETCSGIKCQKLPENCVGNTIPTGACCPVCGGLIKIVYSRKQVDREIYTIKNDITIKSIVESLQKLVKIPTCYLAGYLSIESDLVIIVYTIIKNPTVTQIEVCRDEAIKITNLINTKSHHFTVNLGLSSFIVANYIEPTISSSSLMLSHSTTFLVVFCIIFTQHFRY